jgi:hypothetical protein
MQRALTDTTPKHTAKAVVFGGVASRDRMLLRGVLPNTTPRI